ncbi:MAG: S1 RNA-binding domain-containing protein, partial [Mucinivorans sp.]
MINPALLNKLTIARATDNGVYLEDEDHNEVLLPNRYVPENYSLGDTIEVFIYFDSEDRIVATTDIPKIMLGQVNSLKVVD